MSYDIYIGQSCQTGLLSLRRRLSINQLIGKIAKSARKISFIANIRPRIYRQSKSHSISGNWFDVSVCRLQYCNWGERLHFLTTYVCGTTFKSPHECLLNPTRIFQTSLGGVAAQRVSTTFLYAITCIAFYVLCFHFAIHFAYCTRVEWEEVHKSREIDSHRLRWPLERAGQVTKDLNMFLPLPGTG